MPASAGKGKRATGLPGVTARGRFPEIVINGVFDFYRRLFETGEARRYDFYYQTDGFDNYYQVAARYSGYLLEVSFTGMANHDYSAAEEALRPR